jgi:isocitrate dehydrogenase
MHQSHLSHSFTHSLTHSLQPHVTTMSLQAPITTPRGGGVKSLNVTMRKTLGLFANIRPCFAMAPFVPTNFPDANLVIVRENEEVSTHHSQH